jgi:hypothetical protein
MVKDIAINILLTVDIAIQYYIGGGRYCNKYIVDCRYCNTIYCWWIYGEITDLPVVSIFKIITDLP